MDAIARLSVGLGALNDEWVELASAVGRVLAVDAGTDRPSPAVDVSAVDGYAVQRESLVRSGAPIRLTVAGDALVGRPPPRLSGGAALRIVTGAPVPAGADAVIKREDVEELCGPSLDPAGGGPSAPAPVIGSIIVPRGVADRLPPAGNIRRCAENASAGAIFARRGDRVTAAMAGALASFGFARVRVSRRVRVAVLCTGDEVVRAVPDADTDFAPDPGPWRLRDSNGPALEAMIRAWPWAECVLSRHVADDQAELDRAIGDALAGCDALVLCGGVSMGHRDLVPAALASRGVRRVFHRVRQRPGRPMWGGLCSDGRPVLGLPGNPLSVMVTARRIARPVLARLAGITSADAAPVVTIPESDGARLNLWWHRLVRFPSPADPRLAPTTAELLDGRGSGDIFAAARSDGFVEMPPEAAGPGPWPYFAWDSP